MEQAFNIGLVKSVQSAILFECPWINSGIRNIYVFVFSEHLLITQIRAAFRVRRRVDSESTLRRFLAQFVFRDCLEAPWRYLQLQRGGKRLL